MRPLPRDFFARDTLAVARDLLGAVLAHDTPDGRAAGRIVEVEAYVGEEDAACHAAAGLTARTGPLYGPPGHAYVYFVYGMHWCFNAVTRPEGLPSAVLVRALEPLEGLPLMRRRRGGRPDRELANGPGKLASALGIGPAQNRADLTQGPLTIREGECVPERVVGRGPRVGIRLAADLPYRLWIEGDPHVSRGPVAMPPRRQRARSAGPADGIDADTADSDTAPSGAGTDAGPRGPGPRSRRSRAGSGAAART
ncbi:MAG TPA: DNA-3-methyladenine glycosylase [Gemmatimonadota bacterium]|jgi:DNA-3-methyladenine glycosylase